MVSTMPSGKTHGRFHQMCGDFDLFDVQVILLMQGKIKLSPSEDYLKISVMTEIAFVEYIISKAVFKNVVEFVKKNNKNNNVTQDEIIEGYKKFICEYYKIIKSRETTTT